MSAWSRSTRVAPLEQLSSSRDEVDEFGLRGVGPERFRSLPVIEQGVSDATWTDWGSTLRKGEASSKGLEVVDCGGLSRSAPRAIDDRGAVELAPLGANGSEQGLSSRVGSTTVLTVRWALDTPWSKSSVEPQRVASFVGETVVVPRSGLEAALPKLGSVSDAVDAGGVGEAQHGASLDIAERGHSVRKKSSLKFGVFGGP